MENLRLLLDEDAHLKTRDEEKAVAFNFFVCLFFVFSSVFNVSNRSWAAWTSEFEDHHWWSNDFPSLVTEIVREH